MKLGIGLFSLLIVISLWPAESMAYIDPGTGSILIQGLIAAIAAVGVTLKLYWHRFIGFFRKEPSDRTQPENAAEDVRSGQK